MSIICVVCGCAWAAGTPVRMGNETLILQYCSRCHSRRYLKPRGEGRPA